MDVETRLAVLEKNVASILKIMQNNKMYTDADIAGTRHTVNEAVQDIKAELDFIAMETGVEL